MTLRHMKILVSVYQNSSITRAAEQLHMVQPSVSLAIRELEEYYKTRLFDRIGRRIYPTESGTNLYNYALHIVSLFDEMELKMRSQDVSGSLRVGASITIGNFFLPPMIKKFKEQFPDIQIYAVIKNSENVEKLILDNKIDVALIEGEISCPQIMAEPVLKDHFCLIAPPAHPLTRQGDVTLDDLLPYPFLLRESGSAVRSMVENLFLSHGKTLVPAWESASTQAIIRGVANDLGISILPCLLARRAVKDGMVVEIPVRNMNLHRDFSIIHHRNKYLTSTALAFLDLCRNWGFSHPSD